MEIGIDIITGLLCIFAACLAWLAWQEMKWAGEQMEQYKQRLSAWREIQQVVDEKFDKQNADQAAHDERERRRMLHEADSYNEACSMEPFCGEGKKP